MDYEVVSDRNVLTVRASLGDVHMGPSGLFRTGQTVLMVGDSQVVGPYGAQLHKRISSTGAECFQYGFTASSPAWWMNNHSSRYGWSERTPEGAKLKPKGSGNRATPRLSFLIKKHSPDVVILSLGGNIRKGYPPHNVKSQVSRLVEVARTANAPIVWVSSPQRRADKGSLSELDQFTALLRESAGPDVTFVDSSRMARYVEDIKGDGKHYTRTPALRAEAQGWADQVFSQLA